ncbi:DNA replication and repair protein RecF [Dolichospermum sp. UHCC 0315A]|uniref:AAA family ATPase n=1 Tax=Dolichospermum sp. UHCC 0315A TaxID=1914871 RepID=UPI0011E81C3E|nr:AAA family ATPase [Dolichospermum sp. UHCC 0315A]QEI43966.1 DNA replication and repair protein RecF [Dolichospermum sp. UHCC 0315A]
MRIKQLKMQSFRGIGDLTIDFDEKEPTVFIGINGVGKSSILDAICLLLSYFIHWIGGTVDSENVKTFNEFDIANKNIITKLDIKISYRGEDSWTIYRERDGVTKVSGHEKRQNACDGIWRHWYNEPQYNIPLIVYYPTNRAVIDIDLEVPIQSEFKQIDSYDKALAGGRISFSHLFQWFRNREDIESELRLENNSDYRDKQLEAVRQAISSLMPNFTKLRVRRSPLRMTLQKDGEELIVNQLSDGEKCLLAMVGDLARRLAIANPGLENPLDGFGVVLIDEIELHLHPKWQREIIPALTRTFSKCQFIVTTHSPQVISQIKPQGIYILEKTDTGIIAKRPESSYGRDSNQILEDLMDVPERPQEIKDPLLELFRLIDEGNLEAAKELRRELAGIIGEDEAQFVKADILIRRKGLLRK